jgi:hypothetical protein
VPVNSIKGLGSHLTKAGIGVLNEWVFEPGLEVRVCLLEILTIHLLTMEKSTAKKI